jgi:hypothetical protein
MNLCFCFCCGIVFHLIMQLSNMSIIVGSICCGLFTHFFTFTYVLTLETIKWIFTHVTIFAA